MQNDKWYRIISSGGAGCHYEPVTATGGQVQTHNTIGYGVYFDGYPSNLHFKRITMKAFPKRISGQNYSNPKPPYRASPGIEIGNSVIDFFPYEGSYYVTNIEANPNGLFTYTFDGLYSDLTGTHLDEIVIEPFSSTPVKLIRRCKRLILTGDEENGIFGTGWKTASADITRHVLYLSDALKTTTNQAESNVECSHYATASYSNICDYTHSDRISNSSSYAGTGGIMIRLMASNYSNDTLYQNSYHTNAWFKQWLKGRYESGIPVEVIYPLAVPVETELDISPGNLELLKNATTGTGTLYCASHQPVSGYYYDNVFINAALTVELF